MNFKFYYLIIIVLVVSSCSQKRVSTDDSYESVKLPDGSVVLLNHNSSITYDKDFDPRQVHLSGEAYFKVTPADRPFTVITELGEIEVLGTKFNVDSSEDELEVEVESGKVELTSGDDKRALTRGQRAKYIKLEDKVEYGNAKLEFKIWLKAMQIEFKKLGKEIEKESKHLGKEINKEGKKLNRQLKELN